MTMADAMVTEGFRDAGYQYIVIDDCWPDDKRDAQGRLQGNLKRFPRGMKALAYYVSLLVLRKKDLLWSKAWYWSEKFNIRFGHFAFRGSGLKCVGVLRSTLAFWGTYITFSGGKCFSNLVNTIGISHFDTLVLYFQRMWFFSLWIWFIYFWHYSQNGLLFIMPKNTKQNCNQNERPCRFVIW